ncbi:hypothetical protein SBOR_7099 [Sclerotinia borealis F-4128]|uniref:NACHT domain-containing protein n=1 Tax=Sclerotinia borealis (strain F-4128) TaxID=1432307 RepID=W9C6Y4_SCLBF|nr:hypothetical protein SBOR_7099 [Sclerotinia borealis F-4128]
MMNPLDALSLAGTIIQFVDFSLKVLAGTNELYKSGAEALTVHRQLSLVAEDLSKLSKRLSNSYSDFSEKRLLSTPADDSFMCICKAAAEVSTELNTKLNNLKVTAIGRRRKWQTLKQALKSVWSEKELKALMDRLALLKDSIQMHIAVDLRYVIEKSFRHQTITFLSEQLDIVATSQASRFDNLDSRTQNIVTALLEHHGEVSRSIQDQTTAITQLLGRMELSAEKHIFPPSIVREADKIEDTQNRVSITTGGQKFQEVIHNFEWQEKAIRLQVAQDLIQTLESSTLKEREKTIEDVYRGTFEWLLDDTHGSTTWSSFVNWLRHDSGLYWINGKAGSGKSTLMRFICSHNITNELLKQWSAPLPLVTAKFYFWNSGTLEQRSQSGLLRAILAQILGNLPYLLPVCFPRRWAKIYTDVVKPFSEKHHNTHSMEVEPWSLSELEVAMRTLLSQDVQNFKFCLFVDGLDEYEGQSSVIAEYFSGLARVPWLKICLSSRPLLAFDDAFQSWPTLRLQDLTQPDINHYVKSTLEENPNYKRLCVEQPIQGPTLIETITSRADGVFLWVKLVVRDVIRGLANRDNLQDLQERVGIVPLDLENLFSSMLDNVDPFYSKKAALVFLIVRAANLYGESAKLLYTLSLSFALDYGATRADEIKFDLQDLEARNTKMRDLLKVQCAGLLETGQRDSPGFGCLGFRVLYLHRSVREYLERPDVGQRFLKQVSGTDFEPYTALVYSYVKVLEISEVRKRRSLFVRTFMATVLHYAHKADIALSDAYIESLDTLATLTHKTRFKRDHFWKPTKFSSFLHIAVAWDLYLYVKLKLNQLSLKEKGSAIHVLLSYALAASDGKDFEEWKIQKGPTYVRNRVPPSPRMVGLLLAHGAQPNKKLERLLINGKNTALETAFKTAIRNIFAIFPLETAGKDPDNQYSDKEKSLVSNYLEIVKVLLENGADANTCINYQGRTIMSRKLLTEQMRKHWRSKELIVDEMFAKKGGRLELSRVKKLTITMTAFI